MTGITAGRCRCWLHTFDGNMALRGRAVRASFIAIIAQQAAIAGRDYFLKHAAPLWMNDRTDTAEKLDDPNPP
jgi:hypothetical protein